MASLFLQELTGFQNNTITVLDTWSDEVELKIDMVNTYDHDQDGIRTDQTANYTFKITVTHSKYILN